MKKSHQGEDIMNDFQASRSRAIAWRTLAWWLAGSALLLGALWAGPSAWAAGLESCGEGTVPGPCAVGDGVGTQHDTPVVIHVLANDVDRSQTGLHVIEVTAAPHGTAVLNPDDTVTYTPNTDFSGADEFAYKVEDGLGIQAQAKVIVFVAAEQQQNPIVKPIDPQVDNEEEFTETVRLADGKTVAVTTTIEVPAGAFTVTLRPTDTLAIVFRPVVTPTGNVNLPPGTLANVRVADQHGDGFAGPPAGGPDGSGAAPSQTALRWTRLTFLLDALLNSRSLGRISLAKPLRVTVWYDGALLKELDERSLSAYYWTGSTWSQAGMRVVERNLAKNEIVLSVDRVVGELSFFARSNLLFMPQLRRY
jgi:hypothetical protein